jgi:hypothetical protein
MPGLLPLPRLVQGYAPQNLVGELGVQFANFQDVHTVLTFAAGLNRRDEHILECRRDPLDGMHLKACFAEQVPHLLPEG